MEINVNNPINGSSTTDDQFQPSPAMPTEPSAEIEDDNDINVADRKSPIVMLFGPKSSGKSMTLVRLSRYLRSCGYTIKVDPTFKSGASYHDKCEKFMHNLNTKEALEGTALTDFLLVQVYKMGTCVCQLLEAPGEHYFDKDDVSARNFPPYMTEIIRKLPNRKVWTFITEAEWEVNSSIKSSYVGRISNCKAQLVRDADSFIILYNKVDRKDELFHNSHVLVSAAERKMQEEYPGLANIFRNQNVITSMWRPFNYKFVPFCTGYYNKVNNMLRYTESEDLYPKNLWNALMECIKG